MTQHTHNIRVYYEDTDAGGVVYHSNYLNFAERARTEWLRYLGHQNSDLEKEFRTLFVVKHIDIDYLRPGRLDDSLQVITTIETLKNSSFTMRQSVIRKNTDSHEEMLADIHVVLVCVDTNTIKPVRLPQILRTEFEKFML